MVQIIKRFIQFILKEMQKMETRFFDHSNYFIDEKVNFFKFENDYKVFDDRGEIIGHIKQKISFGQKILRLVISKAILPFKLDIIDANGNMLASIERGWTFFMSKISIIDSEFIKVATIQQKFKWFKPTFKIFNHLEVLVAEITGDWKAWNFIIKDANGNQIGTINKKWAGAMKEIFTSADKYNVSIDPAYTSAENKLPIVSCAITIDMILKEKK